MYGENTEIPAYKVLLNLVIGPCALVQCMACPHIGRCIKTFVFTGSQLTVCTESCYVVTTVLNRCQSQFTSINGNRSVGLLDYISNFNCSSPDTYLIPGLPLDTEKCLQADDLCEFIDFSTYSNIYNMC